MKKYLILLISGFSATLIHSQNINDAMRYAQEDLNGTARFRAMGGAFGALGGDFSALNVNPAGSAIFNNNQIGVTLSNFSTKNKSRYFGYENNEMNNSFDINQVGGVMVFANEDKKSDWKKFGLAINYENANNFDNSIFSFGYNPNNSIANYFINYANGKDLNSFTTGYYEDLNYDEQQAYLGYNGYIINPKAGTANNYESNIVGNGNFYQENSVVSTGYNGKLSFNASSLYKENLYLGISLNSHFTDFRTIKNFYEDYYDSPDHDNSTGVQALRFTNESYTFGRGFSFQVGAIAKATKELRLGLAYTSPTWYNLNEELKQTLVVKCPDCGDNSNPFYADPNITLVYPTYKLQTPGKWTGSMAYVFGKSGLISIDYTLKDYSNTKFNPNNDYRNTNNYIANTLQNTSELRIGSEYRIKEWSIRGGYRFEESPYKNKTTIGDLQSYSTGLGYNFGETRLDLSYTYIYRKTQNSFFNNGFTDGAVINTIKNNVSVTLIFEL